MAGNSIAVVKCSECTSDIRRRPINPNTGKPIKNFFCGFQCKAAWQRRQKPVDENWLRQKYLTEGIDCTAISKIVGRNSKQVWQWLKGYGIPTRPRGGDGDIAPHRWTKGQVSPFKGKVGLRGAKSPAWQGGISPERQSFYASDDWKAALKIVFGRDKKTCQRCHIDQRQSRINGYKIHVHHIVGFKNKDLRCEPANLVLLCKPCHLFVHSRANINKEFLKGTDHAGGRPKKRRRMDNMERRLRGSDEVAAR